MLGALWLIPAIFVAAVALNRLSAAISGGRRLMGGITIALPGLAAVASWIAALDFVGSGVPAGEALVQSSFPWFTVGDISVGFAWRLDSLSVTMLLFATITGFLIQLVAFNLKKGLSQPERAQTLALMNLSLGGMAVLLLAENLPLMFLGVQGVALASLLFARRRSEAHAWRFFLLQRAADLSLILAMVLIVNTCGSLDLGGIESFLQNPTAAQASEASLTGIVVLLLLGAVATCVQTALPLVPLEGESGSPRFSSIVMSATTSVAGIFLLVRLGFLLGTRPAVIASAAAVGILAAVSAAAGATARRRLSTDRESPSDSQKASPSALLRVLAARVPLEKLCRRLVIQPVLRVGSACRRVVDEIIIDAIVVTGVALLIHLVGDLFRFLQTGRVRDYALAVVLGIAAIALVMV